METVGRDTCRCTPCTSIVHTWLNQPTLDNWWKYYSISPKFSDKDCFYIKQEIRRLETELLPHINFDPKLKKSILNACETAQMTPVPSKALKVEPLYEEKPTETKNTANQPPLQRRPQDLVTYPIKVKFRILKFCFVHFYFQFCS
jgi:hypothetical protein